MVCRIKICGITNLEDALLAAGLGVQALGFIFYDRSPRFIRPAEARDLVAQLPPLVLSVGVFVDAPVTEVREIAEQVRLDWLQLHGNEPPDYCRQLGRNLIKAIRLREAGFLSSLAAYRGLVRAFLVDTYQPGAVGGTGKVGDWQLAVRVKDYGPLILAGGLTPDNVAAAIRQVQPWAVDVASGVEAAPGRKDPAKLKAFCQAVQASVTVSRQGEGNNAPATIQASDSDIL